VKRRHVQVENLTDLPTREVAKIVRWVARELDADDPTLLVRVKRARGFKGRYYPRAREQGGSVYNWNTGGWKEIEVKVPVGVAHLVTASLPKGYLTGRLAFSYYSRRETPPPLTVETWQEALVAITAHEVMHHRQYRARHQRASGRRRWQFRETECDFAAYRIVMRWRQR
jgi:hypothetical protein